MKRMVFFIVIVIFIILWLSLYWLLPYKKAEMQINDRQYLLKIADTPAKQKRGLQFVIWFPGNRGMAFDFPRPQKQCFWNKNTLISLRLIFYKENKPVEEYILPPIWQEKKIICSQNEADKAVEIRK